MNKNYKKVYSFTISIFSLALVFGFLINTTFVSAGHDPFVGAIQTSVKICHITGNGNYIVNSPSISGTGDNPSIEGHGGHTDDIIPPFHYEGGSYVGQNWNSETSQIWNNGDCDGVVIPPVNPYCPDDGVLSIEEFLNVLTNHNSPKIIDYNFLPIQTDEGPVFAFANTELYWNLAGEMGTISVTVRNHTGCILPMSLASYSVFDQVLSHQEFFDGTGLVNIPSSDTDTILTIDLPSCMAQIDLWYGLHPEVLEDINYHPYVRMWAFIYNDGYSYSDATGKFCGQEAENSAPVADAGPDQTITLPTNSTILDGSGSSDSDGSIVSYVWSFVSGPTNIDPADTTSTNVSGLVAGTYVFELTITDDDGAVDTDTVTITVNSAGSNPLPQCSDIIDNDSDQLIDALDPGCHTDGDANNSSSYDPNDNDETNQQISQGTGGGTGGRSGSRRASSPDPEGEVLGATTSCGIYVDEYLRVGYQNDVETVKKVQIFLNDYRGTGLTVDGIYGPKTARAVGGFQIAHKEKVLLPWNITEETEIFYLTTQTEVNNIMCPSLNLPIPSNLIPFSTHPQTPRPL